MLEKLLNSYNKHLITEQNKQEKRNTERLKKIFKWLKIDVIPNTGSAEVNEYIFTCYAHPNTNCWNLDIENKETGALVTVEKNDLMSKKEFILTVSATIYEWEKQEK